jgi:DNA-directed RNA polymerase subunit RPC12/RpoP
VIAKCTLCGGENEYQPGEEMIVCSYCGASLAIEKPRGPERLILAHVRNDALAELALGSFLLERDRRPPTRMKTDYAVAPFLMIEDEDGKTRIAPAAPIGRLGGAVPILPAGKYDYIDDATAESRRLIPAKRIEPGTIKILHLPMYTIRYETGGWKGIACVIGQSWQVLASDVPPGRKRALNAALLFAAVGLFLGYLFLGEIARNLVARLALIFGASGTGYFLYAFHERVAGRG